MSDLLEKINTEDLDMLVTDFDVVCKHSHPMDLIESNKQGLTVGQIMLTTIKNEAKKTLGEEIVYGEAELAVGIDNLDLERGANQETFVSEQTGFFGRLCEVDYINFRGDKGTTLSGAHPALIFEIEDVKLPSGIAELGVVSLLPYCALYPGSLYRLSKLRLGLIDDQE